MMNEALYMKDSYMKGFEATVLKVTDGKFVVLDETAFYPNSGGQPNDVGNFIRLSDGKDFKVVFAGKFGGHISHEVDPVGLKEGDKIKGSIDWQRRFKLMRYHTAAHVISAIMHKEMGATITGNQLNLDKARIDFSLEEFDREYIITVIQKANEIVCKAYPVHIKFISRDEALETEGLMKLAKGIPEGIKVIRIVDIEDFDAQACGGTHVKNTSEIGAIKLLKIENKGAKNRRVYFELAN